MFQKMLKNIEKIQKGEKEMKKTMLVLVVLSFLMSSVCFGARIDPDKINVPRDSGRIVETYVSPNADVPVIAYVQNIHANYEAQKAEVAIFEALIRDYGFDLVLLEGKREDSSKDLKQYRNKAKDIREGAAEKLLQEAEIYGIEYLDMVSDYNFTIQGIENMSLYKAMTQDHVNIYAKSEDMSKLVAILQNVASNLKLHIYTKEMRDLDDKITAYDKDEIGLVEYAKFLQGQAAANNIGVKALPNVALFIDSANLEGQINFPAVETERTTVVEAVEKAITDKAKEEFTAKNLQFRTGDIPQGEFYAYLKDTAQTAKVDLTPHKNLTAYTQYITTYEKIDTTLLFKEIDQLVEKLKAAMIKTPEQKKLSQIDKGLSVLSDFVNTKLVPDEYNFYLQNKAEFDLKGWLEFLKSNSAKFGLTNPVPSDVSIVENNLPLVEKFYGNSFDRDAAFMRNIATNLTRYGKDKAILVTGGFHTVNMKRLLKEQGYSYVIIAPKVDVVNDYSELYKKHRQLDLDYVNKVAPTPTPVLQGGNNAEITSAVEKGDKKIPEAIAELEALKAKHPEAVAEIDVAKQRFMGPKGGVVNPEDFKQWVNDGQANNVIGSLEELNNPAAWERMQGIHLAVGHLAAVPADQRQQVVDMVSGSQGLPEFVNLALHIVEAQEAEKTRFSIEQMTGLVVIYDGARATGEQIEAAKAKDEKAPLHYVVIAPRAGTTSPKVAEDIIESVAKRGGEIEQNIVLVDDALGLEQAYENAVAKKMVPLVIVNKPINTQMRALLTQSGGTGVEEVRPLSGAPVLSMEKFGREQVGGITIDRTGLAIHALMEMNTLADVEEAKRATHPCAPALAEELYLLGGMQARQSVTEVLRLVPLATREPVGDLLGRLQIVDALHLGPVTAEQAKEEFQNRLLSARTVAIKA